MPLDLSSCNNLQTIGINSNLAVPAALRATFHTVASKHLVKLNIGLMASVMYRLSEEYDQVFYLSRGVDLQTLGS